MQLMKTTFKEYLDKLEKNPEFVSEIQAALPDDAKSIPAKIFSYDSEMEKVKEKAL